MKTYDRNQVEKPLKVCGACGKAWYMHADLCAECRDPYATRAWRTQCGIDRTQFGYDVNGVVIDGP